MSSDNSNTSFRSEVFRSPTIYGEEFTAQEDVGKDTREMTQHYASFFEQNIMEDPSSWAFLGDKHWRSSLRKASARLETN